MSRQSIYLYKYTLGHRVFPHSDHSNVEIHVSFSRPTVHSIRENYRLYLMM